MHHADQSRIFVLLLASHLKKLCNSLLPIGLHFTLPMVKHLRGTFSTITRDPTFSAHCSAETFSFMKGSLFRGLFAVGFGG